MSSSIQEMVALEARLPQRMMTLDGEAVYAKRLDLPDGSLHFYRVHSKGPAYLVNLRQVTEMHAQYLAQCRGT